MDDFSWSDGVRAMLSSCLPCIAARPPPTPAPDDRPRQSQFDELEGLLADSADTDVDAETLSLHSNVGHPARRRRKKKKRAAPKSIRVFGWDLFGRPAIALPDSDDDEPRSRPPSGAHARPATVSSSSTLDSDAAPLDPAAIARLSSPAKFAPAQTDEELAAEEEAQRAKEERRAQRKERREIKLAAKALALGLDNEEFEGFQGSGSALPHPPPHTRSPLPAHFSSDLTEFGPFVRGGDDDEDADAPDFGGEVYTRKARSGTSNGSGSQSQSQRSHTSASQSNAGYAYNHHYLVQQQMQPHLVPLPPTPTPDGAPASAPSTDPLRKKPRSKTSKTGSSNKSSSATSQSASIPSPVAATFAAAADPHVRLPPSPFSHGHDAPFEGFPQDSGAFPSAGLGGMRRKNSDWGAFLARRGDD